MYVLLEKRPSLFEQTTTHDQSNEDVDDRRYDQTANGQPSPVKGILHQPPFQRDGEDDEGSDEGVQYKCPTDDRRPTQFGEFCNAIDEVKLVG